MAPRGRRIASRGTTGFSETTLAHIYRAEVQRSTRWRVRLDITTNWAVTISAAVISYSFGNPEAPSSILLVGLFAVTLFLIIEARRYRYYDIWARRVRLIEVGYLVPLARKEPVTVDFFSALASEYSRPQLRIGAWQSLAFRMSRTTYPLAMGVLLGAWPIKLNVHPTPALSFGEVVKRSHVGPIPGEVMLILWVATVVFFASILFYGQRIPLPPTELRAPTKRRPAPLGTIFRGAPTRGYSRVE